MFSKTTEKGQALILIALGAIALFAFAALAIDGSRVYSNKRHAQNAADTAVLAAGLAYARDNNITFDGIENVAQGRAKSNGYDYANLSNEITVEVVDIPAASDDCPDDLEGKDITVTIVSTIPATFARVLGRNEITTAVTATSRTCESKIEPPFDGNAIVALAPSGKAYDGTGNPKWLIEGGGIFANSASSNAAYCNGAAEITAPSVSVVGGVDLSCHKVTIEGTINTDASPYTNYQSMAKFFPPVPDCNGTATFSGGKWKPDPDADEAKSGSKVAFSGDMDFAPGLYCITNSPGPYHGALTGNGVTFVAMRSDFQMTFNGSGNSFNASAPTSGDYKGVLIYLPPQVDASGNLRMTQELDLRGNGTFGDIIGTILAPSAQVTMFGNSGTGEMNTQVIAYQVDSGGTADIHVNYDPDDNYKYPTPILLTVVE